MATIDLTAGTFDETVTSNDIVLVDFWAEWCGPCRNFAPVFGKAAEANPDIVFAKVDTEASPDLAAAFKIRAIPTLMAFKGGVLLFAESGILPAAALEKLIVELDKLDIDEVKRQIDAEQGGAP